MCCENSSTQISDKNRLFVIEKDELVAVPYTGLTQSTQFSMVEPNVGWFVLIARTSRILEIFWRVAQFTRFRVFYFNCCACSAIHVIEANFVCVARQGPVDFSYLMKYERGSCTKLQGINRRNIRCGSNTLVLYMMIYARTYMRCWAALRCDNKNNEQLNRSKTTQKNNKFPCASPQ